MRQPLINVFFLLLVASPITSAASSSAPKARVGICSLLANPKQYQGMPIELEADVIAEPHGYHLVGNCGAVSSIALEMPSGTNKEGEFVGLSRKIMANHAQGHVVITGVFSQKTDEQVFHTVGQIGQFIVDDVISVSTDRSY
jgi:hypothetical protein